MSNDLMDQWEEAEAPVEETTLEAMDELIVALRAARDEYDAKKKEATEAHNRLELIENKVINTLTTNKRSKYEVEGVASVSLSHRAVSQ